MSDGTEIPIIMHPGGIKAADQSHYGQIPTEVVAPAIVKDAPVGSFLRFCALPGMTNADGTLRFGHLTVLKKGEDDTRANKARIPLLDAPDGE